MIAKICEVAEEGALGLLLWDMGWEMQRGVGGRMRVKGGLLRFLGRGEGERLRGEEERGRHSN